LECCENGQVMKWDGNTSSYANKILGKTKAGGIPEEAAHSIFVDCLKGLKFLHNSGIVHRDIKPENILLDKDGHAKICDFGEAKRLSVSAPTLSDTKGTYHFFPPEACAGLKFNGFNADTWALGVVLYALIYGTVPWLSPENLPHELFELIQGTPLKFPNDIPSEGVRTLLKNMLNKDPTERYNLEHVEADPWFKTETKYENTVSSLLSSSSNSSSSSSSSSPITTTTTTTTSVTIIATTTTTTTTVPDTPPSSSSSSTSSTSSSSSSSDVSEITSDDLRSLLKKSGVETLRIDDDDDDDSSSSEEEGDDDDDD